MGSPPKETLLALKLKIIGQEKKTPGSLRVAVNAPEPDSRRGSDAAYRGFSEGRKNRVNGFLAKK
ncbi:MAG: hypothetical protein LBI10_05770 [Deltaproteobacteria bacterium]|nr:hypothetical protein [Deltaproteobacteria bacterium]